MSDKQPEKPSSNVSGQSSTSSKKRGRDSNGHTEKDSRERSPKRQYSNSKTNLSHNETNRRGSKFPGRNHKDKRYDKNRNNRHRNQVDYYRTGSDNKSTVSSNTKSEVNEPTHEFDADDLHMMHNIWGHERDAVWHLMRQLSLATASSAPDDLFTISIVPGYSIANTVQENEAKTVRLHYMNNSVKGHDFTKSAAHRPIQETIIFQGQSKLSQDPHTGRTRRVDVEPRCSQDCRNLKDRAIRHWKANDKVRSLAALFDVDVSSQTKPPEQLNMTMSNLPPPAVNPMGDMIPMDLVSPVSVSDTKPSVMESTTLEQDSKVADDQYSDVSDHEYENQFASMQMEPVSSLTPETRVQKQTQLKQLALKKESLVEQNDHTLIFRGKVKKEDEPYARFHHSSLLNKVIKNPLSQPPLGTYPEDGLVDVSEKQSHGNRWRINQRKPSGLNRDDEFRRKTRELMNTDPMAIYPSPQDIANLPRNDEKTVHSLEEGLDARLQRLNLDDVLAARLLIIHGANIPPKITTYMHPDIVTFFMPNATLLQMTVALRAIAQSSECKVPKTLFILDAWNIERELLIPNDTEKYELTEEREAKIISQLLYATQVASEWVVDGQIGNFAVVIPPGLAYAPAKVQRLYATFTIAARYQFVPVVHTGSTIHANLEKKIVGDSGMLLAEAAVFMTEVADALPSEGGHPGLEIIVSKSLAIDMRDQMTVWNRQYKTPKEVIQSHGFTGMPDLGQLTDLKSVDIEMHKPIKKLMDRIKRIESDDVTNQISIQAPSKYLKERLPSAENNTFSSGVKTPMGVYPEMKCEPTVKEIEAVGFEKIKEYIRVLLIRLSAEDDPERGIFYSQWQAFRNMPFAQLIKKYPPKQQLLIKGIDWIVMSLGQMWTVDNCWHKYAMPRDVCVKAFEIIHQNLTWAELAAMAVAFGEKAIAEKDPIELFGRSLHLITNSQMLTIMVMTNLSMPTIMKLSQLLGGPASWKHLKAKMNAVRRDLGTEDRSESGILALVDSLQPVNMRHRPDSKRSPSGNSSPLQMSIRIGCNLWDLVSTFPEIVVNKVGFVYPLVMPDIKLLQVTKDTWSVNDVNLANSFLPNQKISTEQRLLVLPNHALFGPTLSANDWADAERANLVMRSHKQFRLPSWWNCIHRVQQAWSKPYQVTTAPITSTFCEYLNVACEELKINEPPISPKSVISMAYVLSPWRSLEGDESYIFEAKLFGPYAAAAYVFVRGKRDTYESKCQRKRDNSGTLPIQEREAHYWLVRKDSQAAKWDVLEGKDHKPRKVQEDFDELKAKKQKNMLPPINQRNRTSTPSRDQSIMSSRKPIPPARDIAQMANEQMKAGPSTSQLQRSESNSMSQELELSVDVASQASTIDDAPALVEPVDLFRLKAMGQKLVIIHDNSNYYLVNLVDLDDEEVEVLERSKTAELVAPPHMYELEADAEKLVELAVSTRQDPSITIELLQDQEGLLQNHKWNVEQDSANSGETNILSFDILSSVASEERLRSKLIAWDSESSEGEFEVDMQITEPVHSIASSISSQTTEEEVREIQNFPGKGGFFDSNLGQVPEVESKQNSTIEKKKITETQPLELESLEEVGLVPSSSQMEEFDNSKTLRRVPKGKKFGSHKNAMIDLDQCFATRLNLKPVIRIDRSDAMIDKNGPVTVDIPLRPITPRLTPLEIAESAQESDVPLMERPREKLSPRSREREKKKRILAEKIANARESSASISPSKRTQRTGETKTPKKKWWRSGLSTTPAEALQEPIESEPDFSEGMDHNEHASQIRIKSIAQRTHENQLIRERVSAGNKKAKQKQPQADKAVAEHLFSEKDQDELLKLVLIENYVKDRKAITIFNEHLGREVTLNVTPPNTSQPGHVVGSRDDPMGEINAEFLPMCVGNEVKHTPKMILTLQCEELYRRMHSSVYPFSPRFRHARQTQEFQFKYLGELTDILHEFDRELTDPRLPISQEFQDLVLRNPHVLHKTTFHLLLAILGIGMEGEVTGPVEVLAGEARNLAHEKILQLARRVCKDSKTALMMLYSVELRDWILQVTPMEWIDAAIKIAEVSNEPVSALAFVTLIETMPRVGLAAGKQLCDAPNFIETLRRGGLHDENKFEIPEYAWILPDEINLPRPSNPTVVGDEGIEPRVEPEPGQNGFIIYTGLSDQAYGRGMYEENFIKWVKSEALQNAAYALKDLDLERRVCHAGEDSDEPWSESEECTTIHHVLFGKGTWDDSEDEFEKKVREKKEKKFRGAVIPVEEEEVVSRSRAMRVSRANVLGECPLTKDHFQRSQYMINELIRVHTNPHPLETISNYFSLTDDIGRNREVTRWTETLQDLVIGTKLPTKHLSFHEGDCLTCNLPYEDSDVEERTPYCYFQCPQISIKKRSSTTLIRRIRHMFMMDLPKITNQEFRDWHPAITRYSPQVSFGTLSMISSYNSVGKILQSHKLCFMSTEKWRAKLYDRGERMKFIHKPLYKLSHIEDYHRQGKTLTYKEATQNRMMEIPVRLAVADENGHPVILRDFHPTYASEMALAPESTWTGSMRGYSDIIEQCDLEVGLIDSQLREMIKVTHTKRLDDLILKRDNGRRWINAGCTPANSRVIQACNLIDPNMTGTGSTSTQQVKTARLLRSCTCLAFEILRPDEPLFLIVWTLEDLLVLGMPSPDEKVIPFVLSNYLPVRYLYMLTKEKPAQAGPDKMDITPDIDLLHKATLEEEMTYYNPDLVQLHLAWMEGPPSRLQSLRQKRTAAEFRSYLMHEVWQIARNFHRIHIGIFDEIQCTVPERAWQSLKRIHYDPYSTSVRPFVEGEPGQDPYRLTTEQHDAVVNQLVKYQLPHFIHPALCMNHLRKPPTFSVKRVPRVAIHQGREERLQARGEVEKRLLKRKQKQPAPKNKRSKASKSQPLELSPNEIKSVYGELYGPDKMRLCPFIRTRRT